MVKIQIIIYLGSVVLFQKPFSNFQVAVQPMFK